LSGTLDRSKRKREDRKMIDSKVVKIKETLTGMAFFDDAGDYVGEQGLTKFEATWPSGKTSTKYVVREDDVNERRRQESFIEKQGYTAEWE
jgi:hypothetical protein